MLILTSKVPLTRGMERGWTLFLESRRSEFGVGKCRQLMSPSSSDGAPGLSMLACCVSIVPAEVKEVLTEVRRAISHRVVFYTSISVLKGERSRFMVMR